MNCTRLPLAVLVERCSCLGAPQCPLRVREELEEPLGHGLLLRVDRFVRVELERELLVGEPHVLVRRRCVDREDFVVVHSRALLGAVMEPMDTSLEVAAAGPGDTTANRETR